MTALTEDPDVFTREGRVRNGHDGGPSSLRIVRVADVQARAVEWLWRGRLALGKLTLLGGNPGTGKSTISCDISARISGGIPWPDGGTPERGTVLILSAEDAIDDTLRPRLEAAGADVDRVHVIQPVPEASGKERSFSLQDDLARLRSTVTDLGDVRLVILDPITSYMDWPSLAL